MRVRKAEHRDLEAVLALLQSSDLPRDGVASSFDGFVIAETDDGLLGAAGLERYGPHALLRSVVVAAAARGVGVGGALVDRLLADAWSEGVRSVYLLTTTAAAYFAARGFEPVDRSAVPAAVRASVEFASACPATAAVMRRSAVQ